MWSAIYNWLVGFFNTVSTFLYHVILDIIHGDFRALVNDYKIFKQAMQQLFGPFVKALQWLRDHYYQYIYPWVFAIEDLLSRIRVVLAVFRILGFKWAAKLDADITAIQAWVTKVNQTIVGTLNEITTILQLVIDPSGIIRRDFFAGTLFGSLAAIKRAAGAGMDRATTPTDQAFTDAGNNEVSGAVPAAVYTRAGGVVYSQYQAQIAADMNAQFATFGDPQEAA